jgi:integrase
LEFWTYEEYQKFIATFEKGSRSYLMFQLLFWTGMREGEMLALSMEDIDLENCQIHIRKTYYRMNRTDIITEPKTDNSVRTIEIPVFLANEIQFYWKRLYQYPKNERLFPVVAEAVQHTMKRHIEKAGVKKIDVHSLRHSHCAYLIKQGIQPLIIKERLGHKDIKITLNTYGHLYPSEQKRVASLLDHLIADDSEEKENAPAGNKGISE